MESSPCSRARRSRRFSAPTAPTSAPVRPSGPTFPAIPTPGPERLRAWFNTACFSLPAPYTFGDSGRNTVINPAYADVDAGLERDVQLPRGTRIQLRWEVFNLLNRTNF